MGSHYYIQQNRYLYITWAFLYSHINLNEVNLNVTHPMDWRQSYYFSTERNQISERETVETWLERKQADKVCFTLIIAFKTHRSHMIFIVLARVMVATIRVWIWHLVQICMNQRMEGKKNVTNHFYYGSPSPCVYYLVFCLCFLYLYVLFTRYNCAKMNLALRSTPEGWGLRQKVNLK